jgi:hypothetical protein
VAQNRAARKEEKLKLGDEKKKKEGRKNEKMFAETV